MKLSTGLILATAVTGFAALIAKAVEFSDDQEVDTVVKEETTAE